MGAAVSGLLQRLPLLLTLELSNMQLASSVQAQLSRLHHLERLSLCECCGWQPEMLLDLGNRLTALRLSSCETALTVAGVVPAAGWPHLQVLQLAHMPLEPAVLECVNPDLGILELWDCPLLPVQEVPVVVHGWEVEATGAAELLAALGRFTQLRRLDLLEINLQAIDDQAYAEHEAQHGILHRSFEHLEQFAALTASDKLEKLMASWDEDVQLQPLPRYTFSEAVLQPGRQLLGLTELILDALDRDVMEELCELDDSDTEREWHDAGISGVSMDLATIAACCPNLRHLCLNCVLPAEDAEDLPKAFRNLGRKLQLNFLCVGGPWLNNATAAELATLNSLTSLQLCNTPHLLANGLEKLTALSNLRNLEVDSIGAHLDVSFHLEGSAEALQRQLLCEVHQMRAEQDDDGVMDYEVESEDDTEDESEADDAGPRRLLWAGIGINGCQEGTWTLADLLGSQSESDGGSGEGSDVESDSEEASE